MSEDFERKVELEMRSLSRKAIALAKGKPDMLYLATREEIQKLQYVAGAMLRNAAEKIVRERMEYAEALSRRIETFNFGVLLDKLTSIEGCENYKVYIGGTLQEYPIEIHINHVEKTIRI